MILCIDTTAIKTSPDVQKDVNLEDLLINHSKYYDTVEDALKDNYVPLDFSVSVRSLFSNLVLLSAMGRYYTNIAEVQPFGHNGYDLIMYLTSIGLMHNVDYCLEFDSLMMSHSQFQPIGLYNPDASLINPIIYTHVLVSDEGAKELPKYLKENCSMVTIQHMREHSEGNIKALLDTLIEVKEKTENE